MIRLISLPNPRLAQAFVDYMATQGIALEIEVQDDGNVVLWLGNDAHYVQVKNELEHFLKKPSDPRYLAASWQTGTTHSGLHYRSFSNLNHMIKQGGPIAVTVSVICLLVYLLMIVGNGRAVMHYLAFPQDKSQDWQLWRWFSHCLLHFSLLHIVFNLLWWWYLANQIEKQMGSGKLLQITLVAALMSGWAQSLFSGTNFGGLSGVVYALMGYVWWSGERAPQRGISMPRGLMIFAVIWLVVGHFDWFGMSVANAAHIAGLIIGLLMAFWDMRHTYHTRG